MNTYRMTPAERLLVEALFVDWARILELDNWTGSNDELWELFDLLKKYKLL